MSLGLRDFVAEACDLLTERICVKALVAAGCAGFGCLVIKLVDSEEYDVHASYLGIGKNFLDPIMPDLVVFNCFVVFASLVTGFRTGHALTRFTDGASYMHQLSASWFNTASTLCAFCRASEADRALIDCFQETLIRLVSLLNAFCLETMQERKVNVSDSKAFNFELIDLDSIDETTLAMILQSETRVETVFQAVQALIVDNIDTGVLSIQAPILTRSFQELDTGLIKYHEAMKLVKEKTPLAHRVITQLILVAQAFVTPFFMAHATAGATSAFWCAFWGTFMLWLLSGVADTLDNPFQKQSHTLNASATQTELNVKLKALILQAHVPTATLAPHSPVSQRSRKSSLASSNESGKNSSLNSQNGDEPRRRSEGSLARSPKVLVEKLPDPPTLPPPAIKVQPDAGETRGAKGALDELRRTSDHEHSPLPPAIRRQSKCSTISVDARSLEKAAESTRNWAPKGRVSINTLVLPVPKAGNGRVQLPDEDGEIQEAVTTRSDIGPESQSKRRDSVGRHSSPPEGRDSRDRRRATVVSGDELSHSAGPGRRSSGGWELLRAQKSLANLEGVEQVMTMADALRHAAGERPEARKSTKTNVLARSPSGFFSRSPVLSRSPSRSLAFGEGAAFEVSPPGSNSPRRSNRSSTGPRLSLPGAVADPGLGAGSESSGAP